MQHVIPAASTVNDRPPVLLHCTFTISRLCSTHPSLVTIKYRLVVASFPVSTPQIFITVYNVETRNKARWIIN